MAAENKFWEIWKPILKYKLDLQNISIPLIFDSLKLKMIGS
jgi:hypothetical protein